jgi:hypothetical protein
MYENHAIARAAPIEVLKARTIHCHESHIVTAMSADHFMPVRRRNILLIQANRSAAGKTDQHQQSNR